MPFACCNKIKSGGATMGLTNIGLPVRLKMEGLSKESTKNYGISRETLYLVHQQGLLVMTRYVVVFHSICLAFSKETVPLVGKYCWAREIFLHDSFVDCILTSASSLLPHIPAACSSWQFTSRQIIHSGLCASTSQLEYIIPTSTRLDKYLSISWETCGVLV